MEYDNPCVAREDSNHGWVSGPHDLSVRLSPVPPGLIESLNLVGVGPRGLGDKGFGARALQYLIT